MNYGKYRYEQQKKAKDARKKQHVIHLKEIHFRPKTEEHDYQFKTRHIRGFLEEGNKVKVLVDFRGREMAHMNFGYKILERLVNDLEDVGVKAKCSFAKEMLELEFDEKKIKEEKIKEIVKNSGYELTI